MSTSKISFIGLLAVSIVAFAAIEMSSMNAVASQDLSSLNEGRMSQAKELLGRTYKNKVSRKSEKVTDLAEFVKAATLKFLPKAYHKSAKAVAQAILDESANYELDPIFLMAVIQNESSFNPKRKGGMGEIGLMQIKPDTAAWIAGAYGLDYKNAKSLYDPVTNVKIGAALMDKLRRQFDSKSRLYVSAYNIGAKKVRSMVEDKKIPKVYVQAVMKRYIAFYSAFKVEGGVKAQSEAAWMNTINLTRKNFLNRKIAEN